MSKVRELFGYSTELAAHDWTETIGQQACPFLSRKCLKNRKSEADVAIGTCTVTHGGQPIVICPHRFLERQIIFTDCLPLLRHEAGNELHIVSEVGIPGGTVDYFLVSARSRKVCDFVGIEIQTMDTTGTLWPERQRFVKSKGLTVQAEDAASLKSFGMNWKMTAKTILVQLHHKVQTFESVNRHLVLAVQDVLLDYITKEFSLGHVTESRAADPLQIHAYKIKPNGAGELSMELARRLSTDVAGVARALGLRQEARIEVETIYAALEAKINEATLLSL